jgi:hypothetical protein
MVTYYPKDILNMKVAWGENIKTPHTNSLNDRVPIIDASSDLTRDVEKLCAPCPYTPCRMSFFADTSGLQPSKNSPKDNFVRPPKVGSRDSKE